MLAACGRRGSLRVETAPGRERADGSVIRVVVRGTSALPERGVHAAVVAGGHFASVSSVEVKGDRAVVELRTGVQAGRARVRVRADGFATVTAAIELEADTTDRDGDGLPDVLRLDDEADRAAFTRWFAFLAEAQFFAERLPREISDCGALLRFAYREALKEHDGPWATELGLRSVPSLPGVMKYHYPYTLLGDGLFVVKPGEYAQFADAETLMRRNTWFVTRDIRRAAPGDLLFYRQIEQNMPFHAMIYVGTSQIAPGPQRYLVYHTGPVGRWPGEVRRPAVEELLRHPQPRWRPVVENSNFLGVFRWNILKDVT